MKENEKKEKKQQQEANKTEAVVFEIQQSEAQLTEAMTTEEEPAEAPLVEAEQSDTLTASAIQIIKENAREDDPQPSPQLTLRKILGGDLLNGDIMRRQIWLIVLIVACIIIFVATRYQCEQDIIEIDKLQKELTEAKYKAMSSSSELTERCRESLVLEMLKQSQDSLLRPSKLPPYKIIIPEQ